MGVRFVEVRNRVETVSELAMRCDKSEVPFPLATSGKVDHWAGGCRRVWVRAGDTADQPGQELAASDDEGLVAIAIAGSTLYGICAPRSPVAPAIWFTAELSQISVTTEGSQGMLSKRPRVIVIENKSEEWFVAVHSVQRMFMTSGRYQTGQERSLMVALTRR